LPNIDNENSEMGRVGVDKKVPITLFNECSEFVCPFITNGFCEEGGDKCAMLSFVILGVLASA
jgi:hypothetical protein